MLHTEPPGTMSPQRLHTVALSRVMPCGEAGGPAFAHEHRVGADFGVRLERQVKPVKIGVVRDRAGKAAVAHADDMGIFSVPQLTTMYEPRNGACADQPPAAIQPKP